MLSGYWPKSTNIHYIDVHKQTIICTFILFIWPPWYSCVHHNLQPLALWKNLVPSSLSECALLLYNSTHNYSISQLSNHGSYCCHPLPRPNCHWRASLAAGALCLGLSQFKVSQRQCCQVQVINMIWVVFFESLTDALTKSTQKTEWLFESLNIIFKKKITCSISIIHINQLANGQWFNDWSPKHWCIHPSPLGFLQLLKCHTSVKSMIWEPHWTSTQQLS